MQRPRLAQALLPVSQRLGDRSTPLGAGTALSYRNEARTPRRASFAVQEPITTKRRALGALRFVVIGG
jgi:hypothetical protein